MKVMAGEYELDSGELFKDPLTNIGYLKQDVITKTNYSIYEFVLERVKNQKKIDILQILFSKITNQWRFKIKELFWWTNS